MIVRYLVGDVFDRLAQIPDRSVDLVMTSPPFLALRSYLPDGHPLKAKEIGGEPTPAAFIDTMLALTAEWRRILTPHGSIVVELGDTYSGSGGAGGDYNADGLRAGQERFSGSGRLARYADQRGNPSTMRDQTFSGANTRSGSGPGWPMAKSLAGIPAAYELSLAYGWNVLDRHGPDSPAGRWRVRNLVAWVRPNPPVGAPGDKFRPATSYLTVATIARDRWFDLDAVRTPSSGYERKPGAARATAPGQKPRGCDDTVNPAGAPPLDWWQISPGGYDGAHYAVYPPELCERPIEAMCPRRVCRTCGTPSRRITAGVTLDAYRGSDRPQTIRAVELADAAGLTDEHIAAIRATGPNDAGKAVHINSGAGRNGEATRALAAEAKAVLGGYFREFVTAGNAASTTTGWSTCGCPDTDGIRLDGFHTGTGWRPGHVLDPFGGSGTTALVALGRGRDTTLIDINYANAGLALERLGPLSGLEIDWPPGDLTLPALPARTGPAEAAPWPTAVIDGQNTEPPAPTGDVVRQRAGKPMPVLPGQTSLIDLMEAS